MPKKVYAVRVGRSCGLFTSWADCEKQVAGFPGARYKSFATAQAFPPPRCTEGHQ